MWSIDVCFFLFMLFPIEASEHKALSEEFLADCVTAIARFLIDSFRLFELWTFIHKISDFTRHAKFSRVFWCNDPPKIPAHWYGTRSEWWTAIWTERIQGWTAKKCKQCSCNWYEKRFGFFFFFLAYYSQLVTRLWLTSLKHLTKEIAYRCTENSINNSSDTSPIREISVTSLTTRPAHSCPSLFDFALWCARYRSTFSASRNCSRQSLL